MASCDALVRCVCANRLAAVLLSQLSQTISTMLDPDQRKVGRELSRQEESLAIGDMLDPQLSMPAETMKRMKQKQKSVILAKAVDAAEASWRAMSSIPLCECGESSQLRR